MLLVDIDNLKMINDLRGHATGDAVIALTAEAVRESIRAGDQCARFGGDEFLIFAPGCDVDEATKIANRIMGRLSGQSLPLAGARFSVSIGIAVHDGAHADFDRMYRMRTALYEGREDGKSRIGVFKPSHDDVSLTDRESKESQRYAPLASNPTRPLSPCNGRDRSAEVLGWECRIVSPNTASPRSKASFSNYASTLVSGRAILSPREWPDRSGPGANTVSATLAPRCA